MRILKNPIARFKSKDVLLNLYSLEDFHGVLKRERFRSDRNNHWFSLVVFDMGGQEKDNNLARNLVNILTSRLRTSDEMGWFDEQRIAVLLPDTLIEGARILADIVYKEIAAFVPIPIYSVYAYPSQKWLKVKIPQEQSYLSENVYEKVSVGQKMPIWKRAIDILGSSIGLILLSPLFLLTAALIKIMSPGPVFFRQGRVGHSGKIFTFLKFRTMKVNNDATTHRKYLKELINGDSDVDKPMKKLGNDSRIIPMGKFLRKSCIDELPQLINVIRGEMSLVGPRPCIPYEAEEYLRWHTRRFDITPGMTGLWQVNGKNHTTFKKMIRLDIKYAEQLSFWLDTKILLKTPIVVLSLTFGVLRKLNNNNSLKKNELKIKVAGILKFVSSLSLCFKRFL